MIIVVNFGSQFAHLIARRVRDLGVHAEIVPYTISRKEIEALRPEGVILSGGPDSVLRRGAPKIQKEVLEFGVPVLGICYGHQLLAHMLGGRIEKGETHEYGKEVLSLKGKSKPFAKWPKESIVWFSHGDTAMKLPKGFKNLGSTKGCTYAAMGNTERSLYGVQFHPEVTHTAHGKQLLSNFLFDICNAKKDWKIASLKKDILKEIKETVPKDEHVLVAVSGGVDSLVVAALLHKALGKRVHAVLIDTGLLRKNEAQDVVRSLKAIGMNWLKTEDASSLFLRRLKGVTDPEEKRKIIGHSFIDVFEKYVKKNLRKYPITYLAQGTIYPDRIESAQPSKTAAKIKSHHNLTLPEKMHLKVIEPIRELYKDEVRKLGRSLGLPAHLLNRHPFPGPGLGIRILGDVNSVRVKVLQEADNIYMECLKEAGEYEKIWQAFAALLPVKSVGVMGDARTYENIVSLRAVNSVDGMTADWHDMPPELLERISSRIVNEVRGVNRVLYDVTQKPPGTIEYE